MKLKVDDKGAAVLQNGKPVYVMPDGREVEHDAEATVATIARLNGEARTHREAKEAAESKLKLFEGIDDAEAARAALTTVKSLTAGDLKTAAQVKEITDAANRTANESVAAATRAAESKLKEAMDLNAKKDATITGLVLKSSFASSKFVTEKLAIPPDIAQTFFSPRLRVEDGKLVPLDRTGNPLFSATRHGEHADLDEAMQVFVSEYPDSARILKGSGGSGGGAGGSGNPGAGGKKTITRAQFSALSPMDQAAAGASAGKGELVISD